MVGVIISATFKFEPIDNSHEAKGWSEPAVALMVCVFILSPPLNRLSKGGTILEEREKERKFGSSGFERGTWWMSTSLGPHPESSVDSNWRPVDEHRKKERKKCRLVHGPGIELRSGGLAPLVLPSGP